MLIQQKRIRTLERHLPGVKFGTTVVLGASLVPAHTKRLTEIGFATTFKVGDSVLPSKIGPVTRFNAEGRDIIHRDKPMETAYRQVEWHYKEFRGPHETEDAVKIADVPYKRYPRTRVKPPSVELRISVTADGQRALLTIKLDHRALAEYVVELDGRRVGLYSMEFDTEFTNEWSKLPLVRAGSYVNESGEKLYAVGHWKGEPTDPVAEMFVILTPRKPG